jgi:hypothetical protein
MTAISRVRSPVAYVFTQTVCSAWAFVFSGKATPRKPPTPPTKKPKTVELHDDVEDEAAPTQPYREEESEDTPKKPPLCALPASV